MSLESECHAEVIDPRPSGGQTVGAIVLPVRVTHIPTGITATVGICRSQLKNKQAAMEMVTWGLLAVGWEVTP